jgi:hypothetical protein
MVRQVGDLKCLLLASSAAADGIAAAVEGSSAA